MTKRTQIFTALLILIAGGIWLLLSVDSQPANNSNDAGTSTQTDDIPADWEIYENTTYNFSIAHPPEATIQTEGIDEQNHIKFMYLGSPQATGHINDGFTLTVSTYDKNDTEAETLETFVHQQLSDQQEASDVVQAPEETSFYDRNAFKYRIESIGIIDITAVETDDTFVTISHSITDPNDAGYARMVAEMKRSLAFTDSADS